MNTPKNPYCQDLTLNAHLRQSTCDIKQPLKWATLLNLVGSS